MLAAPLVARNRIIGALALLVDDQVRVFTADETRVAQTIAGQVATAIDTLELIEEVRHQRDVAEALSRTATALSRNLESCTTPRTRPNRSAVRRRSRIRSWLGVPLISGGAVSGVLRSRRWRPCPY